MNTKDFILLGAGYAAGRLSKRMSAGPIGAVMNKKTSIKYWENPYPQGRFKTGLSLSENKMFKTGGNNTIKNISVYIGETSYNVQVPINYSGKKVKELINTYFGLNIKDDKFYTK